MNNWGMDGNNSIINKRERLILILPFLTGFGAATALRPVFCFFMYDLWVESVMVLA